MFEFDFGTAVPYSNVIFHLWPAIVIRYDPLLLLDSVFEMAAII